jgi:glycosyltransferase involved in cell wall biosynthesis
MIKVSICMVTYNHEKFIKEAIDGILSQKAGNFTIELVIGEDISKDSTRKICIEYSQKYPEKIRLLLNKQNLGAVPNFISTLNQCDGDYIALCEGDDTWTDPDKLIKQIGFLEQNPEYVMCCHNAMVIYEKDFNPSHSFNDQNIKEDLTIADIAENWFIPTASIVYRRSALNRLPDWVASVFCEDYVLQLLLADKGKIKYFNQILSVYRKNFNSVSFLASQNFLYEKIIEAFVKLNEHYNFKYDNLFKTRIASLNQMINKYNKKKKYDIISPFFWVNLLLHPFKMFMLRNNKRQIKFIRF